eukprot:scaffold13402_cov197-Skeletonema_marinoi.AAC.1
MVLECALAAIQVGPHQVTYDAVATLMPFVGAYAEAHALSILINEMQMQKMSLLNLRSDARVRNVPR